MKRAHKAFDAILHMTNPGGRRKVISEPAPPPAPSLPGDVATDFFEAQGATQPWYAGSTVYNAVHYNGKTYVAWETWEPVIDKRFIQIRAYTHATGTWGRVYTVGKWEITQNDDHGVPSMAFNADGRMSIIYQNHDGNQHLTTMTNPEDESHWTFLNEGVVGLYTYPHMTLIGSTIYATFRKNIAPGVDFPAGAKVFVYRPITYVGAVATVGAEVTIGDLGDNSRWYQGNMFLIAGDRVAQVAARADYNDVFRRHTYYYEIDFANARLQAFDGTTAAFPVNQTTMNSTFRVHETVGGTSEQSIPQMLVSGSETHIVFHEGVTDGDTPIVKHIKGEGGVFSAPINVFTHVNSDVKRDGPTIVQEATDIGMYYSIDPDDLYLRGGNVARRIWNGSSWSSEQLVMSHDAARAPLGQIGTVFNPHANGRVIFTEAIGLAAASGTDEDSIPWKRGFVLGDNGFLPAARPPASSVASFAAEGAWYDPRDITSLWEDAARTIPASVGGLVRVIDDKSGNGHHWVVEGTEPGLLRLDDGLYWIEVGDPFSPTLSYAVSDVSLVADNAYWVCGGYRDNNTASGATSHTVICLDEGSGLDRIFSIARQSDDSNGAGQIQCVPFSNAGTGASFLAADNGIRSNDDFIVGLHVNGTLATGYWNEVQFGTNTVATVPDTGPSRLRTGANATRGAGTFLQGRFYGAIVRAGNIDLATREADMAYIRTNMPL